MIVPAHPKVFHIVHIDRLGAIIAASKLLSDAGINASDAIVGTTIGVSSIKQRQLHVNTLSSYPVSYAGQCVPFYSCPRSIYPNIL